MIFCSCSSQNEKGRYVPLSKMLNTILMEFRDKEYSIIPRPSSHDNKEEIVFLPNDPTVIKSHYLIRDTRNPDVQKSFPKRKPDIIGVFLSHLCEKYIGQKGTNMTEQIGRGSIPKKETGKGAVATNLRTTWKDIHLTWELKRKSNLKRPAKKEWTVDGVLGKPEPQPDPKAEEAQTTKAGATTSKKPGKEPNAKDDSKGKRKRNDNDDDDGDDDDGDDDDKKDHPAKKSRSDSSGKLYNNGPPPDVQCAYYGAERLAALFSITHSIVILLTGKSTLPLLCQFLTCGY